MCGDDRVEVLVGGPGRVAAPGGEERADALGAERARDRAGRQQRRLLRGQIGREGPDARCGARLLRPAARILVDRVGQREAVGDARQTIHAAARSNGLRASFAPLITSAGVGQGWHLHTSVARDGRNLLAGGPSGEGASWIAGLLRELPAITAVTTPSVPSQIRLRPGYFAGAYAFWGVENREAALRYVPGGQLLGADAANIELKACDASANPYLALAAVIAAGLAGIADGFTLPGPIDEDPGGWSEEARAAAGVRSLPTDLAAQEAAMLAPGPVAGALGPERIGAFLAARRSDAAWAADKELDEIVAAHLWRY